MRDTTTKYQLHAPYRMHYEQVYILTAVPRSTSLLANLPKVVTLH